MMKRVWRKWRRMYGSGEMEEEMSREMRFHLEMEAEKNLSAGMTPEEARRQAVMKFGGLDKYKEECREVQRIGLIENLVRDVRYGARVLARNRGFSLLAILTLALGIGANTAIFSVIYGVLLRPLPFEGGKRLVVLRQQAPLAGVDDMNFSVREIADYREQSRTLEGIVEHHSMSFTLFGHGDPERIQTGVVSANFFEVLGVKPLLGRTFLPEDERHGAEAVLVLSHEYWRRSHGGDPNIVGRVFAMNDRQHTVVGVLPPLPQFPNKNDLYMPTTACPTRASADFMGNRNARMMDVVGRLKEGVSIDSSQAELGAIAGRLQMKYPESYPSNRGFRAATTSLQEELTRDARPTFLILLGTAGLVLLIACANVANLMLARLIRRDREMALRTALGASRGRLIRQLLTESALLALAGGAVGIILALLTHDLLVEFASRFTVRAFEIRLDATVLLFTAVISIATGLGFGSMPALAVGGDPMRALKDGGVQASGGSGRHRVRSLLVVAQVAIAFVLLIAAGLMVRSLLNLQRTNPGFNPEKVLVLRASPNWSKYTTGEQYKNFALNLLDKVHTQPGVIGSAMATNYPLNPLGIANGPSNRNFMIEGQTLAQGELSPQADFRVVSTGYFQAIGLPLIRGRVFTDDDREEGLQVAIVNQSLARRRWGNDDPIGKRVSFNGGENWVTIVGVVSDARHYGLDQEVADEIYRPIRQTSGAAFLLVRTSSDPLMMVGQLRRMIHNLDPETAIDHVRTLEEARLESMAPSRLTATLLAIFAILALLITTAGIAGVISLSVTQRTHEIGIRMALGARPIMVLWMVLRQGMTLTLAGLLIGTVGALILTRVIQSFLFAVEPTDPITYLGVGALLAIAAAIACYLPARRAVSIDPLTALRTE